MYMCNGCNDCFYFVYIFQAMQKHVVPHNFSLEEKRFILTSSVLSVDGELDGSSLGWQALRRGKGLVRDCYSNCTSTQLYTV